MATGDRVKIITSTQFDPLNQQINDSNTGLAGRVVKLEENADLSNANPYDPARAYVAGNLALVDGRLHRANKATTGTLNLADWEDLSSVVAVTANRAIVSDDEGKLISSSVTRVELEKIRGGAAIQDDDITDSDAFLHNATGTMKQTGFPALWRWITSKVDGAASKILTDNLTPNKLLRTDADGKVTEMAVSLLDATSRIRQDTSVTNIAADERDLLTKKDGDALYGGTNNTVIGYFQQSSSKSNNWTTICSLGGIEIQARNPISTVDFPVRILNSTGQTLAHLWDMRQSSNSFTNGVQLANNGAYFNIEAPNSSQRLWAQACYNVNGAQLGGGAWSYEIGIYRIGFEGYRIVAKLQTN